MKNRILKVSILSLCGLMLSFGTFAQESDRVWSIGPEIGASFSKHGKRPFESYYINSEYRFSFLAGGFVTYSIEDRYAFTGKILFNQKGSLYEHELYENDEVQERLNYIEIPILARVYLNRKGAIRLNVFAGPSFGFLTAAQWKIGDDDYKNAEDIAPYNFNGDNLSYRDVYSIFDFGVSIGLGLNIKVANRMYFILDTRYTYGFSDFKESDGDSNNENVAFAAGFSFGIRN